jgi:hypothetical protein
MRGERILLMNCVWFIFLRRGGEVKGGNISQFLLPQIGGIWRGGEVREDGLLQF